jgi:hypothetical protein
MSSVDLSQPAGSGLGWMANQLESAATLRSGLGLQSPRYNPRPRGVLQEGGAAKSVLSFLQAHPDRFFTFAQIVTHTGRTHKSLDWACIFLRSLGYVECSRDEGRNSRYLRYRVAPSKESK